VGVASCTGNGGGRVAVLESVQSVGAIARSEDGRRDLQLCAKGPMKPEPALVPMQASLKAGGCGECGCHAALID
jgi:hypothetical protein